MEAISVVKARELRKYSNILISLMNEEEAQKLGELYIGVCDRLDKEQNIKKYSAMKIK